MLVVLRIDANRDSRFATAIANEVEVPSLHDEFISRTPPLQVIALSWQCDIGLHLEYDF